MVAHYSSYYAFDFYVNWFREYASEIVSIFFVLAGYGAWFSFTRIMRRREGRRPGTREVAGYYWKRALRIYPLYWLALFTVAFILPEYAELHRLSLHTAAVYLGYPGVVAPGVYWFIPALIQCYLLAPVFYLTLAKLGHRRYLVVTGLLVVLAMGISRYYAQILDVIDGFGIPDPEALFYRSLFLANVILFALGMAIPRLAAGKMLQRGGYLFFVVSLTLFGAMILAVRDPDALFTRSHFYLFPLFIFSVFALCLSLLSMKPALPFLKLIGPLGERSYPLYLFHRHYFGLLAAAGLIGIGAWSVVCTLALFPAFFLLCMAMEGGLGRVWAAIGRWLKQPWGIPSQP
jgi:peptidoglycan/LPS O-acetylase OafA/YrhL